MRTVLGLLIVLNMMLSPVVYAIKAGDPLEFSSEEEKELYREMLHELRCTVCQNQSLADSNASLAEDLRTHLYNMVTTGVGKEKVKAFMVDRYGEFVLYKPSFTPSNYLLWFGPFLLLLLGVIVLIFNIKTRSKMAKEEELTSEEHKMLSKYLDSDKGSD
ncbi:MAG: cytochrome c-type biogenesis protein CcmH [Thiomicrorhabdus sp.]|nr:MAG: cytochrome c-type biogenesis protein CcmH [Thiomicrorhabdus sp.]